MLVPATLLLAHHGTAGARAAEAMAFGIAERGRTTLVHALIVPDFWDGMQGDDWLNNASTRDAFARHLEGQLESEIVEQKQALAARCAELGLGYRCIVRVGDPTASLVAIARTERPDLVVIGPPRAKGQTGFRSRMKLDALVRDLRCPLLIAR